MKSSTKPNTVDGNGWPLVCSTYILMYYSISDDTNGLQSSHECSGRFKRSHLTVHELYELNGAFDLYAFTIYCSHMLWRQFFYTNGTERNISCPQRYSPKNHKKVFISFRYGKEICDSCVVRITTVPMPSINYYPIVGRVVLLW